MRRKQESSKKGLTNPLKHGIIKKNKERGKKIMKMVIVKIGGVVVDKDCYSLAKIREIEKAGFTVESVK